MTGTTIYLSRLFRSKPVDFTRWVFVCPQGETHKSISWYNSRHKSKNLLGGNLFHLTRFTGLTHGKCSYFCNRSHTKPYFTAVCGSLLSLYRKINSCSLWSNKEVKCLPATGCLTFFDYFHFLSVILVSYLQSVTIWAY